MCCRQVLQGGHPFPADAPVATVHLDLRPELASAARARTFVLANVRQAPPDLRPILAILTSELVTNAVVHAQTPVQVAVSTLDEDVVVAVGDRDPSAPEPRVADPDATNGRGLALVGAMATEWGVQRCEVGKTVWFLLRADTGTDW